VINKVIMPKLGFTMTEGTITTWLKAEGEHVKVGEILFEVETDKVVTEVEARVSGILRKILAPEGKSIKVGDTIAIIAGENDVLPEDIYAKDDSVSNAGDNHHIDINNKEATEDVNSKKHENITGVKVKHKEVIASPLVRKIAKDLKIDINEVIGTGNGGKITEKDVNEFFKKKPVENVEYIKITNMRKTIAERMLYSWKNTAGVTYMCEADCTKLRKLKDNISGEILKKVNIKLTYTDFFIRIVSKAITEHPLVNSSYQNDFIEKKKNINIGLAVEINDGLIVPVIKNLDKISFEELVIQRSQLVEKARSRKLTIEDLSGGTITISNLGMYGIDYFTPIINLPESAILGIGQIKDRVIVKNNEIVIRPMLNLSLKADHRIIDGAQAARFLKTIASFIENIDELFKE